MPANIPDTSAGSMITSSRSLTGKSRLLSARVAAVVSSTQTAPESSINDAILTLACMLAGITSMTASRDVIEMGLYTAADLCQKYGVDPATSEMIIAAFRKASPAINIFPEGF
jgi:hypothetical protein